MNLFQEVKEAVTTRETASFYGIEADRKGMVCCPFHNDHTPSMKLDKRYHCFGCGEDGDVINFVAKLFGLSQYDAAIKLVNDMDILVSEENLPRSKKKNGKESKEEKEKKARVIRMRNRAKLQQARERQLEEALSRVHRVYCDYFRLLNRWAEEYSPSNPEEEPHPLFLEALQKRDQIEHLLDTLDFGTAEEKALVLIDKAKEIDELERRIKEYEPGDRTRSPYGPAFDSAEDDSEGSERSSGTE